jgi:uncharacterized peroxidase-related enzyme
MAWIQTISFADADDTLRDVLSRQTAVFPPEYIPPADPASGPVADIVLAHSLIPQALHHAFGTIGALLVPELPLSRRDHELVATAVSATNRCQFCRGHHAEFLRRVTLEEDLVEALLRDPASAPLDPRERLMVAFAVQVTRDATQILAEDLEALRAVGFEDRGILQLTLLAAFFNYINRVADALGVGREASPSDPCPYGQVANAAVSRRGGNAGPATVS